MVRKEFSHGPPGTGGGVGVRVGRGVPGGSRRTTIILGQGWQGTWEIGYTQWEESKDKLLRIMKCSRLEKEVARIEREDPEATLWSWVGIAEVLM